MDKGVENFTYEMYTVQLRFKFGDQSSEVGLLSNSEVADYGSILISHSRGNKSFDHWLSIILTNREVGIK